MAMVETRGALRAFLRRFAALRLPANAQKEVHSGWVGATALSMAEVEAAAITAVRMVLQILLGEAAAHHSSLDTQIAGRPPQGARSRRFLTARIRCTNLASSPRALRWRFHSRAANVF
jgi:hypothetical protein